MVRNLHDTRHPFSKSIPYVILNKNGKIVFCSDAFKRIALLPKDNCPDNPEEMFSQRENQELFNHLQKLKQNNGTTRLNGALTILQENFRNLWFSYEILTENNESTGAENHIIILTENKTESQLYKALGHTAFQTLNSYSELSRDFIVQQIINAADEISSCEITYCFLANKEKETFDKLFWSANAENFIKIPEIPENFPFSSAGAWTESFFTKAELYVTEPKEIQLFNIMLGADFELKTLFTLPVICNNEITGVFGMINFPENSFNSLKQTGLYASFLLNNFLTLKEKEDTINHYKQELEFAKMRLMKSSNELLIANEKLKNTTEELKKALRQAKENETAKIGLLNSLSQEIRTPMNAIVGFSDLLTKEAVEEKQKQEFIDIIEKSGKQMMQLVNDVIDLSKIQSNTIDIIPREISLNKIVLETYMLYYPLLWSKRKNKVRFSYHYGLPDGKDFIVADEKRLRQVLSKLLSNAINFTKEGSIEMKYELTLNNYLRFVVRDTGIGIPKNRLGKLFDLFTDQKWHDNEGTGMGLAIAKSLVELMGGKMWVESVEGSGSSFYFTIPYEPASLPVLAETAKTETIKKKLKNKKILVAEDEIMSFKLLEKILSQTGAEIVHAENGKEALDMIKATNDFDLIIMDIRMPVMDGITATKEIKRFNSAIPVIVETAYTLYEEEERAKKAGCDDFITKPINRDRLLLTVLEHVV